MARRLREYNFQYEHDLLSIITIQESFASESEVRAFYNRELNCPCIILYAEFSGSAFLVNALVAGMLEGQTKIDDETSLIDFSPRITTLWEISYNSLNAIQADYAQNKNKFGWLDVIETYTETFIGLNTQTFLDEYFRNVPVNLYQSQTTRYLKDKESELKQIGLWGKFEKVISSRHSRIKQQQALLLNKLKANKLFSDENVRVVGSFEAFQSQSAIEMVGKKWSFRNQTRELVTPYLVAWNGNHSPSFSSGTFLLKNKHGMCGFLNTDGYMSIPFTYEDADLMADNHSAVCKDGKWGLIDIDGNLIIPFKYEDMHSPKGGFANFKRNNKWGLVGIDGIETIGPELDVICHVDYERVIAKNKKLGLISVEGEVFLNFEFDEILNLNHEFCLLSKGSDLYVFYVRSNHLLNLQGAQQKIWEFTPIATIEVNNQFRTPWQAYSFYQLSESFYLLAINLAATDISASKSTHTFILSKKGTDIQLATPGDVGQSGVADVSEPDFVAIPVADGAGKGFLSPTLDLLIPCNYQDVLPFSQGLGAIRRGDHWGFIDASNTIIVSLIYEQVKSFSDGLAAVQSNGKWGFIDLEGTLIVDCVFLEVSSFQDGRAFARFTIRDSWAILDTSGNILVEAKA